MDLLRDFENFRKTVEEYPELKVEKCRNEHCLIIIGKQTSYYDETGLYRIEWLKQRLQKGLYSNMQLMKFELDEYSIKVCLDIQGALKEIVLDECYHCGAEGG